MATRISLGAILFLAAQLATAGTLHAIVFNRYPKSLDPKSGRLCSVSPTGRGNECLPGIVPCGSPSWQPGGRRLVVGVCGPGKRHELVLLNAYGKRVGILKHSVGYISPIVWSPDGKYIYAVDLRNAHAIGRWDASGKHFTSIAIKGVACDKNAEAVGLSCDRQYIQEISFSPSGKKAAIVTSVALGAQYVAKVHDREIVVAKKSPKGFVALGQSVWLDETHLLFEGAKDNGPLLLWKLDVDTGRLTSLGNGGLALALAFALSPDHRFVVVSAGRPAKDAHGGSHTALWRYSLNSGATQQLTHGAFDISPSWRQ